MSTGSAFKVLSMAQWPDWIHVIDPLSIKIVKFQNNIYCAKQILLFDRMEFHIYSLWSWTDLHGKHSCDNSNYRQHNVFQDKTKGYFIWSCRAAWKSYASVLSRKPKPIKAWRWRPSAVHSKNCHASIYEPLQEMVLTRSSNMLSISTLLVKYHAHHLDTT